MSSSIAEASNSMLDVEYRVFQCRMRVIDLKAGLGILRVSPKLTKWALMFLGGDGASKAL